MVTDISANLVSAALLYRTHLGQVKRLATHGRKTIPGIGLHMLASARSFATLSLLQSCEATSPQRKPAYVTTYSAGGVRPRLLAAWFGKV